MNKRLTTDQLVALFVGRWQKTHDLEECVEALYEAGITSTGSMSGNYALAGSARLYSLCTPVLEAVAARYEMTVREMLTGVTRRFHSRARHEVVWVLRQMAVSFPDCAIAMGWDNHASAIYAERAVEARIAREPGLRDELLGLIGAAPRALRSVA